MPANNSFIISIYGKRLIWKAKGDFLRDHKKRRTRKKSVNRPGRFARRPEVGVEPSEFISDGGGGEILPRRAKRCKATFCEIINLEKKQ